MDDPVALLELINDALSIDFFLIDTIAKNGILIHRVNNTVEYLELVLVPYCLNRSKLHKFASTNTHCTVVALLGVLAYQLLFKTQKKVLNFICEHCSRYRHSFVWCEKCKREIYCSKECRKKNQHLHKHECFDYNQLVTICCDIPTVIKRKSNILIDVIVVCE